MAKQTTKSTKTAVATKTPASRVGRTKSSVKVSKAATAEQAVAVPRRAIFIDVENTSSESALVETLNALAIDRRAQPTDLTAVGNWRAVGLLMGRRLAALGAQLVHSAPARGVRDWSDLWIAVAAGCWLGQARPGDILEIVSNDRAFDAVGDAAAARGVIYRRLQHRHGVTALAATGEVRATQPRRGRSRRGRGRGQRRTPGAAPIARPGVTAPMSVASTPHGATATQISAVIQRLTHGEPSRWVNLDVLEKALKADGFSRPPGSPRLVTRLRALKEMEVDAHGRVRLRHHPSPAEADSAQVSS